MKNFALATLIIALPAACAFAGGELSAGADHHPSAGGAMATRAHIAALQAGLSQMEFSAASAAQAALDARASKVVAVGPVQDRFGDPMYTAYGPLVPEPGTPEYDGPRYGASFARGYAQPVPDAEYRGYTRGRFSQPGLISHTGNVLGTAASNMYMQAGMQVAPGSMAPSAARAMINNP